MVNWPFACSNLSVGEKVRTVIRHFIAVTLVPIWTGATIYAEARGREHSTDFVSKSRETNLSIYAENPQGIDAVFFFSSRPRSGQACQVVPVYKQDLGEGRCRVAFASGGHCLFNQVAKNKSTEMFSEVRLHLPGINETVRVKNAPGMASAVNNGDLRDVGIFRFDAACSDLTGVRPARLADTDQDGKVKLSEGEYLGLKKRQQPFPSDRLEPQASRGGEAWIGVNCARRTRLDMPSTTCVPSHETKIESGDSGGPIKNSQGQLVGLTSAVDSATGTRAFFDEQGVGWIKQQMAAWGLPPMQEVPQQLAEQPSAKPDLASRSTNTSQRTSPEISPVAESKREVPHSSDAGTVSVSRSGSLQWKSNKKEAKPIDVFFAKNPDGTRRAVDSSLRDLPEEASRSIREFYSPFVEKGQQSFGHKFSAVSAFLGKPPSVPESQSHSSPPENHSPKPSATPVAKREAASIQEVSVPVENKPAGDFVCKSVANGEFKPQFARGSHPVLGPYGMSEADCNRAVNAAANGAVCAKTAFGWKPFHFSGRTQNRPDGAMGASIQNLDDCLLATSASTKDLICVWNSNPNELGWIVNLTNGRHDGVSRGTFPELRACIESIGGKPKEKAKSLGAVPSVAQSKSPEIKQPHMTGHFSSKCLSCHGSQSNMPFEAWLLDPKQLEAALESDDETKRAYATKWAAAFRTALVDKKNMPPDPLDQSQMHADPQFKQLVAFLEKSRPPLDRASLAQNRVQVLPKDRLETYRRILPSVVSPELQRVLADPNTIFYDEASLPRGYQDDSSPVVGVRGSHNSTVAQDAAFIDPTTGTMKVFSHPGGLPSTSSAGTFNFISLPKDKDGNLKKIRVKKSKSSDGGDLWDWQFPEGTISGEVVFANDKKGASHVLEIRTRKTAAPGEVADPDIFVPMPTQDDLRSRLTEIHSKSPSLANEAKQALVALDSTPLTRAEISTEGFTDKSLSSVGATQKLPNMSDALVTELLNTPFRSSRGAAWHTEKGLTAFAPTTTQTYGLVPQHSLRGALSVDRQACTKCHDKANVRVRDLFHFDSLPIRSPFRETLNANTYLYGRSPGGGGAGNGNLRWHPFDPRRFNQFSHDGIDNRSIRPEFAPIIEMR